MDKHLIGYSDLQKLVSDGKSEFFNLSVPMVISKRRVDDSDLVTVAVANALLSYLNRNGLLTSEVKFDFRGDKEN